jgi:hypothetical protein
MPRSVDFTIRSDASNSNVITDLYNNVHPLGDRLKHDALSTFATAVVQTSRSQQRNDNFFTDPANSIGLKLDRAVRLMQAVAIAKSQETTGISTSDFIVYVPVV